MIEAVLFRALFDAAGRGAVRGRRSALLAALLLLELPLAWRAAARRGGDRGTVPRSVHAQDPAPRRPLFPEPARVGHGRARAPRAPAAVAAHAGGRHRCAPRWRSSSSRRRWSWLDPRGAAAGGGARGGDAADPAGGAAGGGGARSAHAQPRGRARALSTSTRCWAWWPCGRTARSRRWRASTRIGCASGCAPRAPRCARRWRPRRSQALVGFGLATWLLADHFARTGAHDAGAGAARRVLGAVAADARLRAGAVRAAGSRAAEPDAARWSSPWARPRNATTAIRVDRGRPRPRRRAATPCRSTCRRCVSSRRGTRSSTSPRWRSARASTSRSSAPSGAGKSSLVGLLLGWHRPAAGTVTVDGRAARRSAELEALRQRTVWVDPTVYLWNRSLAANLGFGLAPPPPDLAPALERSRSRRRGAPAAGRDGDAARRGGRPAVGGRGAAGALRPRRAAARVRRW